MIYKLLSIQLENTGFMLSQNKLYFIQIKYLSKNQSKKVNKHKKIQPKRKLKKKKEEEELNSKRKDYYSKN